MIMGIREEMPILARHEGVWEGMYRYYDAEGKLTDEHKSRLVCRFPNDGPHPYHQTNYYTWADGKTEIRDFPATYKDKRVWWDNENIQGYATEATFDDHKRTVALFWQRTGDPELCLYEMIQINDEGTLRNRIWHWYRKGVLIQRTQVDEHRVSHSTQGL
jgi:hypothetical protein